MDDSSHVGGFAPAAVRIAIFTLIGAPIVAFIWETLNQLMAGHFVTSRVALAGVAVAVFLLLLRLVAREVRALEAADALPTSPSDRRQP
jgi:hypothetical protein